MGEEKTLTDGRAFGTGVVGARGPPLGGTAEHWKHTGANEAGAGRPAVRGRGGTTYALRLALWTLPFPLFCIFAPSCQQLTSDGTTRNVRRGTLSVGCELDGGAFDEMSDWDAGKRGGDGLESSRRLTLFSFSSVDAHSTAGGRAQRQPALKHFAQRCNTPRAARVLFFRDVGCQRKHWVEGWLVGGWGFVLAEAHPCGLTARTS